VLMYRFVRRMGAAAATVAIFTSAAVASVLLHLDLPELRRVVEEQLMDQLAPLFEGKIVIERIGHLGLDGVGGIRVSVLDPELRQVLSIDGVRAHVSRLDVGRSLLFGKGPVRLTITELSVDHADIDVGTDSSGALRLRRAFDLRDKTSSPKKPP